MFPIEKIILPNHSGREGHLPIAIVNHVTQGNKQSVINTFKNTSNNVSSTFLNCRDGSIVQFCELWTRPKTNGYIKKPKSTLVQQMGSLNPNYYTITIENEDAFNDDTPGVDGTLTEKQFTSLCWLHKFIQVENKRIHGNTILLNPHQVFGHRDVDSVGKALCPGNNFPFQRLYAELAIADKMTLEAYEERLDYLSSPSAKTVRAFQIAKRMESWHLRQNDPKWGAQCKVKILMFAPLLNLTSIDEIHQRICKDLYVKALGKSFSEEVTNEAIRKLMECADFAEEKGIL